MFMDPQSTQDDDRRSRIKQAVSTLKECSLELRGRDINLALTAQSGPDVDNVVPKIADAIGFLSKIKDPANRDAAVVRAVNSAMDQLRSVLETLQTVSFDVPEIDPVTRRIAKVVALLYPLSKADYSRSPDRPSSGFQRSSAYTMERRSAPRIPVEAEVGFQSDTNFFMGFSEDISLGGLFVATFDTRPLGSAMSVNLSLPDGHLISADGIVRWVREYRETAPEISPGMGIQFDSLSSGDRAAIEAFIRKRPALFYDDE